MIRPARRLRALLLPLCLLAVFGPGSDPARAHFRLNTNIRIVHVERLDGGVRLTMRLPTPLVYAGYVEEAGSPTARVEAPYLVSAEEGGGIVHYLDAAAIAADPAGFGRLVAGGYRFVLDGEEIGGDIEAVRVHPAATQPRFAELAEAKAALEGPPYPPDGAPRYVGDTVVDVAILYPALYPARDSGGEIRFSSTLPASLPAGTFVANLFLDTIDGERRITRATGLLREPVVLNTSATSAALTFVVHGVAHILGGLDHVLFVLCLTIGAMSLGALLWRVTGFTIGHTATLIAGFFGYAPGGAWFIPAVEAAIALSIVYAGAVAMLGRPLGGPLGSTFVVTLLIGLLHGFGFSFVLGDMLQLEAPHLLTSLLSFNLGVEAGQLLIVVPVYAAMRLMARRSARLERLGRWSIATPCVVIAALWTGQRALAVVQALG